MTSSQDQVRQWGAVAEAYMHSSFHAGGPDLARLVSEAGLSGHERVLDVGCGAGHTTLACALHAAEVVGVDVTPQMVSAATALARDRGVANVEFRLKMAHSTSSRAGSALITTRTPLRLWRKPSVSSSPVVVFWFQTRCPRRIQHSIPSSTASNYFGMPHT